MEPGADACRSRPKHGFHLPFTPNLPYSSLNRTDLAFRKLITASHALVSVQHVVVEESVRPSVFANGLLRCLKESGLITSVTKSRIARIGGGATACAIAVAGFAVGASPATAATTATFNYTGSAQNFVVPTNVKTLSIVATGGGGGGGQFQSTASQGGAGGVVTSSLTVTPGQTLTISVGGGGAAPANPVSRCGGGGGSSIVTQAGSDVIVTGGGGGGGLNSNGGHAGNSDGSGSAGTLSGSPSLLAGQGGNVGGTGGGGASATGGTDAQAGGSGTRGAGGDGQTGAQQGLGGTAGGAGGAAPGSSTNAGGGGGGAGYGGGGGGRGSCTAGGGGGSLGPAGTTYAVAAGLPGAPGDASDGGGVAGTDGGDGQVVITYTPLLTPVANPNTILGANAKIKRNGTTKVTSANPKTTTGQTIRTSVKCQLRTRGDIRLCRVIRKSNGATYIRTYGYHLKITITWYSAETSTSLAYKKVRTYKT